MEYFFSAFPGPLPLEAMYGKSIFYLIALGIGIAFGYTLEIGGFGKSTKLAAQFYFTDMTVFKVMFTGIIVAMVLVFGSSALGWLDYSRVFVNPTYLWPGLVGGLIMGVGFVVGGFCPGTSLVALATFKKDGIAFVAGLTVGIFAFGENIDALFSDFWNSSNLGRFTLAELFDVPLGVLVFGIVVMALALFWLVEYVEDQVNQQKRRFQHRKQKVVAASLLAFLAFLVMTIGQPDVSKKWQWMADMEQPRLDNREVQIVPVELLDYMKNDLVRTILIDVRDEADFNLFHLIDAQHLDVLDLPGKIRREYLQATSNTLFVLMSNDEERATEAWKIMRSEAIENVYILDGGVNNWLDTFVELVNHSEPLVEDGPIFYANTDHVDEDIFHYKFGAALGSNYAAADPEIHDHKFEYIPKVKMKVKKASGGG